MRDSTYYYTIILLLYSKLGAKLYYKQNVEELFLRLTTSRCDCDDFNKNKLIVKQFVIVVFTESIPGLQRGRHDFEV